MTTLTSQATFSIGESSTDEASVSLTILPAIGSGAGRGRLIHPTLGTYDYPMCPDEWSNVDGDVIIPPVWASSKTLQGASNTLFSGHIRDVVVEERWLADSSVSMDQVRMFVSFWQNPPDPAEDFVEWYPNYTNGHGYRVILLAIELNGIGINLDYVARQGYARGALTLRMRIADRAD